MDSGPLPQHGRALWFESAASVLEYKGRGFFNRMARSNGETACVARWTATAGRADSCRIRWHPTPTAWPAEDLLPYLPGDAADRRIRAWSTLSAPGSQVAVGELSPQHKSNAQRNRMRSV